jgi:class 3 adenylate cyclase
MFLDVEGSTSMAERLSKEAYYSFVNDFFRRDLTCARERDVS